MSILTQLKKTTLAILALSMMFNILLTTLVSQAAGVAITVAPATSAVSTAGNVTLTLTLSAAANVGTTIRVAKPTAYTGTATMTVSAGAIGAVTNPVSGTDTVTTATVTTLIPAGALTITIGGLTTPAAATNAAWKVYVGSDYGANFQYVGQFNVTNVRARVPLQLAFDIRNTGDTANTNVCDMGDLTSIAVGFCEYRLKITTNAQNGYTINVATTGNLTNGTANLTNAAVGTGGAGGTNIVAGTETYGVKVTKGSITGVAGTTTLAAVYDAGATNRVSYVAAGPATLLTANKPNSPLATDLTNTTLVRHEAAITASTPAGLYTQTVTYTIAPSF